MRALVLLLSMVLGLCGPAGRVWAEVKKPDTFTRATTNTIKSLDPASAYDMASMQKVENVYEKLIAFDGEHLDRFVPVLAAKVPSLENGGISADGKTYTFEVRKGVKFQEGGNLTPSDVEYSIERMLIMDQSGGPAWMLLEALTGESATRDKANQIRPGIFERILAAVAVDGDRVVFKLPKAYPPFLGLMAKSWASVVDKEWVIAKGGWDGTLATAATFNQPTPGTETLFKIMNGTGPYRMASWEPSVQFVFKRHEQYWGEKPALEYAVYKIAGEWSTRKLMLQSGDADSVLVDDQYVKEAMAIPGVKHYKLPMLAVSIAMFCQKIDPTGNPYIGSGKLDGDGIPPDFFADINVRKAFAHAFDRAVYAEEILQGISTIPTNPIVPGLPCATEAPVYAFDLQKAAEYMRKAWGGQVWEKGFKMSILHNTGNSLREGAARVFADNVMSLNPKFKVEVADMSWRDYLTAYRQYRFPMWMNSWVADYPDPHNFAQPLMSSDGSCSKYMAAAVPEIDALVKQGIETVDPAQRAEIYKKLAHLWYEHALGVPIYQSTEMRFYRDWVHGVVANPLDAGDTEWLYRLSKH